MYGGLEETSGSSFSPPFPGKPHITLVLYQTWSKWNMLEMMMTMYDYWSTRTMYINFPQVVGHTQTYIWRKNTFDMPLKHSWRLGSPTRTRGSTNTWVLPLFWNPWLCLGGSVTTCRQMGRINVFITSLRVCVSVGGGGGRRGQSVGTCMAGYRPYQVQGSLFPFSAWLNFESTSLHVNIHRKLH